MGPRRSGDDGEELQPPRFAGGQQGHPGHAHSRHPARRWPAPRRTTGPADRGPPCTPFSKSGFWLEWKREGPDPDASLLQAYTRVLAEARPHQFVLENVYALTYGNKASKPAFERLVREIDAAGYHFQHARAERGRLLCTPGSPAAVHHGCPKG